MGFWPRGSGPVVHDDRGKAYEAPHWRDLDLDGSITPSNSCSPPPEAQRERAFPVVYMRGECPVVSAKLVFPGLPERNCVKVRGLASVIPAPDPHPIYLEFKATAHVVPDPADPTRGMLDTGLMASRALPDHMLSHDLAIAWEVSLDGGSSWIPAGASHNRLHVTFGRARPSVENETGPRETVLDIACRRASGLADETAILDAIWGDFEDPTGAPEVRRKPLDGYRSPDSAIMRFWAELDDLATLELVDDRDLVRDLVDPCDAPATNGRGTCKAWSLLLGAAFDAAGLTTGTWRRYRIHSQAPAFTGALDGGADLMLGEWDFRTGTFSCWSRNDLTHKFGPPTPEVFTLPGLPGQGVARPPTLFNVHFVVKAGDRVLDPSFGRPFVNEDAWESALLDGHRGTCVWWGPYAAMQDPPGSRETTFRASP